MLFEYLNMFVRLTLIDSAFRRPPKETSPYINLVLKYRTSCTVISKSHFSLVEVGLLAFLLNGQPSFKFRSLIGKTL